MEKSKNKFKKFFALLVICIILMIIYEVIHIYAVFQSEVYGDIKFENGTWKIIINGTEVSKGVDKNFTIDNINIQDSEVVKNGNIAPGLSRYF